jgi:hypothetical protein
MHVPIFELDTNPARLLDVNPRAEMNGPDTVPAVDLKLSIKVGNDMLAMFSPSLKSSIYSRPDGDSGQAELLDDPNYMPSLRFPLMSPFRWAREYAGHELRVHYGFSGADDIILQPVKVNKFTLEPQEGGTVVITFRVQAHADAAPLGRLCSMIGTDLEVSLIAGEPQSDDLLGEAA